MEKNIIQNHDFSEGLHYWQAKGFDAFVVPSYASNLKDMATTASRNFVFLTKRNEHWQGLEQDITEKISPGSTYSVSACVGVSGPLQGSADVKATLKLEHGFSNTSYLSIGR